MQLRPRTLVDNEPSDADVTSDWVETAGLSVLIIDVAIASTGTPVGVLKVQGTSDPDRTAANIKTFTLPSTAIHGDGTAVSGANQTMFILRDLPAAVRFWYDSTDDGSSAGGVTVFVSGRNDA